MGASLYEPINEYKPVAPNIGIIDGPFEYLTVGGVRLPLPFTTRMTVVRLTNGDLFLHSPIKFDNRLANELQGFGTPRHLVSPNQFHYAHIGEWAKAFPAAIAWASPRVRERARSRHIDIEFTRDLDAIPPEEWRREIDQALFPGGYFKEFIFFHKASKTLILTDTIINIELDKVTEPWRTATKLTGMYHPHGQIFFGMRLPLLLQRRKAKAALGKIHSWQPQRILLSHGRCFDAHADEVIRRMFGEPHCEQLATLRRSVLVTVRRDGRSMIYTARFETMNALVAYLTENCCKGAPDACTPAVRKSARSKRGKVAVP